MPGPGDSEEIEWGVDHETPGGREIGRSFLEEVPGGKTLRGQWLSPGNEPMLPGRPRCSGVGFLGRKPRLKHLGKGFLTAPGPEAGVGMVGRERLWQQVESCSSKAGTGSPRPSQAAPPSTFSPKAVPEAVREQRLWLRTP